MPSAFCLNLGMERLRDHTRRIARAIETDDALSTLNKFYFDAKKPRRFISGIAISSREQNANGVSFVARGVDSGLPTPLLWNHEWHRPLGRVIGIETRGDQVRFRAEIGNNMEWVDQIWQEIVARNAARVSVEGDSLLNPVVDGIFAHWRLTEISVVQFGADRGALINRVWEKMPFVRLDAPSEIVHWSEPC